MSEWISVKDRLPEDDEEVIVACNYSGGRYTEFAQFQDCRKYGQENPKWVILSSVEAENGPDDIDGEVTHWMPIPEPPKEEKQ